MAILVVDALEVVKIEEEQPDRRPLALCEAEHLFQRFGKHAPVVQAGKQVVCGQVAYAPHLLVDQHRVVGKMEQGGRLATGARRCRVERRAQDAFDLMIGQQRHADRSGKGGQRRRARAGNKLRGDAGNCAGRRVKRAKCFSISRVKPCTCPASSGCCDATRKQGCAVPVR